MNNLIFYVLAVLAGCALTTQTGVNTQLRVIVGNPVLAALISFLVGTFALLLYLVVFERNGFRGLAHLPDVSWYKLTGGLIGAVFVSGVIILAPRIGAANLACLVVGGQLLFALLLDHFGLLGFALHKLTIMRFLGAALLIAGVFLIVKN